jgi:hypothetical protein
MSLDDARRKCEASRRDYDEERLAPQSATSADRGNQSVSGTRPAVIDARDLRPQNWIVFG